MKIIVSIKQAPARDSLLRINAAESWIQEDDLGYEINEPDAYALEEALQLKEKNGGEVIALCAGPARAAQTIREALAKGADRAIHIEEENLRALDPLAVASLMAKAIGPEKPDLILTGLQSDDVGYGQTGVILAELLGLPHATIIMQVEVQSGAIKVKRELEDGWFQHVEMPLPALLLLVWNPRILAIAPLANRPNSTALGRSRLRVRTALGVRTAENETLELQAPTHIVDRLTLGGMIETDEYHFGVTPEGTLVTLDYWLDLPLASKLLINLVGRRGLRGEVEAMLGRMKADLEGGN